MRLRTFGFAIFLTLALSPFTESARAKEPEAQSTAPARPPQWATPIEKDGAPNLNRIAPNFYRSAQPSSDGFKVLSKEPGIRTVVSLRAFHSDLDLLEGTGIALVRIPIHPWHIETEDIVLALAAIRRAEAQGPLLLHCQHGADRRGLITALYRILYQDWTKEAALAEMQHGNFGYHAIWGNIPHYVRELDVAALKQTIELAAK